MKWGGDGGGGESEDGSSGPGVSRRPDGGQCVGVPCMTCITRRAQVVTETARTAKNTGS